MNISNFNQSVETSSSPQTTSQPPPGLTTFTQVTYSVLASIALVGNTLVIVVFIQDRKLLRKSYNILILSLAVADVLTAISLITNPAFVLGDAFPYPTNPILGDIFCRVIWSRTFLFQLVVFSGYICLALVTERWYAVMRPLKYSETFNKKRTLIYIFTVWLWSLVLCCSTFFEVQYVSSSPSMPCKWVMVWKQQRALVGSIQVFFKMVLPSFTMLILFIHMTYKAGQSTVVSAESKTKLRGKMTRMIGAACLLQIICFAPNQTNYALALAGITRLDSRLHHILSLLVFVNSCLNPFIYGLSNKNYRHGYQKIFVFLFCCGKFSRGSNEVAPSAYENGSTAHKDAQENFEITNVVFSERDNEQPKPA